MKIVYGDLITMAQKGDFDVIIHGCNCFNNMGAGIAKTIKLEFPSAYKVDCDTLKGDRFKLGSYSKSDIELRNHTLTVINAYTQFHYGAGLQADYNAIRSVFKKIKENYTGKRIGYPMIGAGLAGGDWNIIYPIICEELEGEDHTLVIYKK